MKKLIPFLILCTLNISILRSQSILIENINLIDVETGKIKANQNILIKGEKIISISSRKTHSKEGVTIINGIGKYIMPGMIDTHIHFFQTGGLYTRPDALDMQNVVPYEKEIQFAKDIIPDSFKRYLRLGITSVMDVGGPFYNFAIRDNVAKNNLSPNVYLTGPLFSPYQPEAFSKLEDIPIEKITSIEEATVLFNKMLPYKPDFIKIWYIVNKENPADKNFPIVKHIAELSHKNNLKLAVHATQQKTAELAIKAGADILVHSIRDHIIDDKFIDLLKKKNITYIPTLIVSKNYLKAFLARPENHLQDLYFANPKVYGSMTDLKKYADNEVPRRIKEVRADEEKFWLRYRKNDSVSFANLKRLTEKGVNIATGTDAGNIGTMHASSYIQEIETMQKSGMNAIDIIKASTINAAKGFGLDASIGSIAEGKLADLIILDKNPLENIQNLNTIHKVLKSGNVLGISELIIETPEQIVQRQVNAYNARNIDAFMDTYADDIKIYSFPEKLSMDGKEQMRARYKSKFEQTPNLYCEIKNRIVLGNKVVDREYVRQGEKYSNVIAIYEVKEGKISKVTFLR